MFTGGITARTRFPGIRELERKVAAAGSAQAIMTAHGITVNSEAAASIHDDGLVILHTRSGRLFTSNRTGASIWRCIVRQLPFEAIADEIGGEYGIARTTAREHTARFLAQLERHNLIDRGPNE